MLALLLAASVTAAASAPSSADTGIYMHRGPAAQLLSSVCHNSVLETSGAGPVLLLRPQDRAKVRFRRLGDLPKANKEIAVLRQVRGCTLPVIVSYQVEQDGRFAGR